MAIEVADTGGGLDAAILPRFFEPFATTRPRGGGERLGFVLSSSHGLILGMDGTIAARNDAEGPVLTVTLPCAVVPEPA